MKKTIIIAFSAVLLSQTIQPAAAQKSDVLILKYDVFSEGKKVGKTTVKLSKIGKTRLYSEFSHIKTTGGWGKIDVKSVVVEEHKNGAGFIRAGSKTLDAKTVYHTSLTSSNSGFTGTFAKIRNTKIHERNEVMDLAVAITGKQMLDAVAVTTLSPTMYGNQRRRSKKVQLAGNAFDTTLNNLPFFLEKYSGSKVPAKLNVMDSENLDITAMNIKDMGSQNLAVGEQNIKTRYFKLSATKNNSMTIWIKSESSSLPHVIRIVGKNQEGSFELRLRP